MLSACGAYRHSGREAVVYSVVDIFLCKECVT
jgi:hypothetical protein